jgi:hypothetical protein
VKTSGTIPSCVLGLRALLVAVTFPALFELFHLIAEVRIDIDLYQKLGSYLFGACSPVLLVEVAVCHLRVFVWAPKNVSRQYLGGTVPTPDLFE